jgi:hypothetical protein
MLFAIAAMAGETTLLLLAFQSITPLAFQPPLTTSISDEWARAAPSSASRLPHAIALGLQRSFAPSPCSTRRFVPCMCISEVCLTSLFQLPQYLPRLHARAIGSHRRSPRRRQARPGGLLAAQSLRKCLRLCRFTLMLPRLRATLWQMQRSKWRS